MYNTPELSVGNRYKIINYPDNIVINIEKNSNYSKN